MTMLLVNVLSRPTCEAPVPSQDLPARDPEFQHGDAELPEATVEGHNTHTHIIDTS